MREAAEAGAAYDHGAVGRAVRSSAGPGIAVAEEHGGQGLGAVELAVLLEELGYACAATPFLSTAAAAAAIQARRQRRAARALAAGAGVRRGDGRDRHARAVRRRRRRGGARAARATVRRGDARDARDADVAPLESIDPTRRYATVSGGDAEPLGDGGAAAVGAADRIRAAIAAEVVGVAQRALEMTLEYVKERKQFGVPVGSFQAVQNRCAQMLLDTESARSTALFAAWAADADARAPARGGARWPRRRRPTAAASVTASAIQAHGGIGFTWEADVHWLYKRAQLDAALLGGARRHRARLAALAAARRGPERNLARPSA